MLPNLREQYHQLGLGFEFIDPHLDFNIVNTSTLYWHFPHRIPAVRPQFFILNLVKQARGFYTLDGERLPLQPYTIYLINPGHHRAVEYQELDEAYLISVSERFLKENVHAEVFDVFPFMLTESLPPKTISPVLFAEFECLYLQLEREYQRNSPFRARLIGHLLVVLLLKFKAHCWPSPASLPDGTQGTLLVAQFQRALEQHYNQESQEAPNSAFRMQDYAEAQHLHPTHLAQVIKNKTGKSVGTWIAERTIVEAKAQLLHTNLPIKEISYQLGFAEPAHFSSYFKKHTQLTPQQYRQQSS